MTSFRSWIFVQLSQRLHLPRAATRGLSDSSLFSVYFSFLPLSLALPPSLSPKLEPKRPPPPQQNPSRSTQESRLYRTKNTVISARSSVTGPPRSSAPSPLHLHPLRSYSTVPAQRVSAPCHGTSDPASVCLSALVVLEDMLLAGCRAPGGFQVWRGGPHLGMLVGASPTPAHNQQRPGFEPKHLLSSPLHPRLGL